VLTPAQTRHCRFLADCTILGAVSYFSAALPLLLQPASSQSKARRAGDGPRSQQPTRSRAPVCSHHFLPRPASHSSHRRPAVSVCRTSATSNKIPRHDERVEHTSRTASRELAARFAGSLRWPSHPVSSYRIPTPYPRPA